MTGDTELPMQARWRVDPALKDRAAAGKPLGRVGTTQDMADACLFLLSDRASFITGTELVVASPSRLDATDLRKSANRFTTFGS